MNYLHFLSHWFSSLILNLVERNYFLMKIFRSVAYWCVKLDASWKTLALSWQMKGMQCTFICFLFCCDLPVKMSTTLLFFL